MLPPAATIRKGPPSLVSDTTDGGGVVRTVMLAVALSVCPQEFETRTQYCVLDVRGGVV